MWNGQARLAHALLLEQHDVEVERARSPARRADASSVSFDPVERGEEILGRQLSFDGDHLIEKRSLRDGPDCSGLFGVGLAQHSCVGERGDGTSRLRQKYFTLAEIGA